MKKAIVLMTAIALLLTVLVGCGSKDEKTDTVSDSSIDSIKITSGGYPVVVQAGSVSEITYSIASDDITVSQENGLLTIDVPEPSGGINLSSAPTLTVTLPQKQFQKVSIIASNAGDISVSNIGALALDINIEYGNIQIKGIEGFISAKADMGEITTTRSDISSDVVQHGVSASLEGQIGSSSDKVISISSQYGFISIE